MGKIPTSLHIFRTFTLAKSLTYVYTSAKWSTYLLSRNEIFVKPVPGFKEEPVWQQAVIGKYTARQITSCKMLFNMLNQIVLKKRGLWKKLSMTQTMPNGYTNFYFSILNYHENAR